MGVHHAAAGAGGGEGVLLTVGADAEALVVAAADGGGPLRHGGIKGLVAVCLPGGVGVPGVGLVAVLGGDDGHLLGAVVQVVEVVAEPAVQDLVVAGIADVKTRLPAG